MFSRTEAMIQSCFEYATVIYFYTCPGQIRGDTFDNIKRNKYLPNVLKVIASKLNNILRFLLYSRGYKIIHYALSVKIIAVTSASIIDG